MVAGILEKSKRLRNPFFFDIRKTPKLFCSARAASPWKTRALWRCPIQGPVKKKITQQRTRTFRHSAPPARDSAEYQLPRRALVKTHKCACGDSTSLRRRVERMAN